MNSFFPKPSDDPPARLREIVAETKLENSKRPTKTAVKNPTTRYLGDEETYPMFSELTFENIKCLSDERLSLHPILHPSEPLLEFSSALFKAAPAVGHQRIELPPSLHGLVLQLVQTRLQVGSWKQKEESVILIRIRSHGCSRNACGTTAFPTS